MVIRIVDDIIPAKATLPGNPNIYTARLIFTPDEVIVFVDEARMCVLKLRAAYTTRTVPESLGEPFTVVLASGDKLTYLRGGGCGCGNPIRNAPVSHVLNNDIYPA